jgi:hypothetical protein
MTFDELAFVDLVLIARLLGLWDLGGYERNGFEQNVLRLDITVSVSEESKRRTMRSFRTGNIPMDNALLFMEILQSFGDLYDDVS